MPLVTRYSSLLLMITYTDSLDGITRRPSARRILRRMVAPADAGDASAHAARQRSRRARIDSVTRTASSATSRRSATACWRRSSRIWKCCQPIRGRASARELMRRMLDKLNAIPNDRPDVRPRRAAVLRSLGHAAARRHGDPQVRSRHQQGSLKLKVRLKIERLGTIAMLLTFNFPLFTISTVRNSLWHH